MRQHGTALLHLREGRTPGLIGDAALPGGLLKVPTKLEVVALFAPLPVLQEPTADPVGLMSQAINVAMVVQQLQGSRQAAAAAGCRAAIWHQPFECTGLLGESGGVAQCRPHGGAILPTSQKRARGAIDRNSGQLTSDLSGKMSDQVAARLSPVQGGW